jgi:oligoendopeptidase F
MAMAAAEVKTGAESVIWDLSIFYSSADDPAIAADMARVQTMADEFAAAYRGRVKDLDAEELIDALQAMEAIYDLSGRFGSFAGLNFSTDTADPRFSALMQRVTEHGAALQQKLLFFELEWKALPDDDAAKRLSDPTLGKYRHYLESERRFIPHTLSEIEEKLLVEKSVTGRTAWSRFFTKLTSAMRYPYRGEQLTQSQVLAKLYDPDRVVRQDAAAAVTEGLRARSMELTYIFNVILADKASDDSLRHYPTWVSSRNLDNKASDAVVEALIHSVTARYDLVARHYRIKRALLGMGDLYDYDRYAPLNLGGDERAYTWDEAREVTAKAYTTFSPRLGEITGRFFEENWIHAALMPNKRGGAFCSGTVPSAHPYVFMNYTGRVRDVMTLAHELGHGVHFYLAAEAQGIVGMNTPLTTAEMASTFGEMLVFDELMARESDPVVQLGLVAGKIEDSFATIFRQISMNRFEDALHTARRTEGELAAERINALWLETQRQMFGDSVTMRDEYGSWWSYVGHFVGVPGYVYAYAFGELLVLALVNLYRQQGAAFAPQYLDVLAAGDSDYPEHILRRVGIDLTDPQFWNGGLAALEKLVEQEEALARQAFPNKF